MKIISLVQKLSTLVVRKWHYFLVGAAISLITTAAIVRWLPVTFEARALIQVEKSDPNSNARSELLLLRSQLNPELFLQISEEFDLAKFWRISDEKAIQKILRRSRIEPESSPGFYSVIVRLEDPVLSESVVESVARALVLNSIQDNIIAGLPDPLDAVSLGILLANLGGSELINELPLFLQNREILELKRKITQLEALQEVEKRFRNSPASNAVQVELRSLQENLKQVEIQVLLQAKHEKNLNPAYLIRLQMMKGYLSVATPTARGWWWYGWILGLGFLISFGAAYVRVSREKKIYSYADLDRFTVPVPYLGSMPHCGAATRLTVKALFACHREKSDFDETFRYLRIALNFVASPDPLRIIPVASIRRGEGKTFFAAHLAASLGIDHNKTLLVDADFEHPSMKRIFPMCRDIGLSNYLEDHESLEKVVFESGIQNLDVVPAGSKTQRAKSLLFSKRMQEFLKESRERYDRIIIDGGVLQNGGLAIASAVGQWMVVTRAGFSSEYEVRQLANHKLSGGKFLGLALNQVPASSPNLSYENHLYQLKMFPPEELG